MEKFGPLVWAVGGGYPIFAHLLFNFRRFCRYLKNRLSRSRGTFKPCRPVIRGKIAQVPLISLELLLLCLAIRQWLEYKICKKMEI